MSKASADAAWYRPTYVRAGSAKLSLKFQIAPLGKLDAFITYLDARLRRAGR